MSHITDIKLRITNLDALAAACEALGLELMRGQRAFAWWGTFVGDSRSYGEMTPDKMGKCDHAIRIKGDRPENGSGGPWEIGVMRSGDGFSLFYDTYGSAGRRLSDRVGQGATLLRQEYAAAVSMQQAQPLTRKGFVASREKLPNGMLRIALRRR